MKPLSPLNNNVHIIGIGGIGVSGLARWFLAHGSKVSGSDVFDSPLIKQLRREGAEIKIGHQGNNLSNDTDLVIYSAAVTEDNPELKKAKELGIKTKLYSEALGDLSKKYKTIAVAGAHGKSTTTSLLSLVLAENGFDPTVIVGTKLKEFGDSNFRNGKSDCLVMEADEYKNSFLNYFPEAAIITNIDKEHLDYYKDLNDIKNTFLKFIKNIKPNGILVLNEENEYLFGLKSRINKIAAPLKLKIIWYSLRNPRYSKIISNVKRVLKIFGEHNVSNALAVYLLAKELGMKDDKSIFGVLGNYHGAWRRMEYRGELRIKNKELRIKQKGIIHYSLFKIPVYDDYGHHPTEIKATLSGARTAWPRSKIICVFQPHQAQRLKYLFKEFVTAFDSADYLILLDIYQVTGREQDKLSQNIASSDLAKAIKKHLNPNFKPFKNRQKQAKNRPIWLKRADYLPSSGASNNELKSAINNLIQGSKHSDSYVIIMMGAGDIVQYTDNLLKS